MEVGNPAPDTQRGAIEWLMLFLIDNLKSICYGLACLLRTVLHVMNILVISNAINMTTI